MAYSTGVTGGARDAANIYQKLKEDEDEILDILVCLQRLHKKIEQIFPEAQAFIRTGLDEIPEH